MNPSKCRFGGLWLGAAIAAFGVVPTCQAGLTQIWRLNPGDRTYLTGTGDNQRGLTYNAATNHVLVADHTTTGTSIHILKASDGSDLGSLSLTGVSGGTFAFNQIAVASDGAIYASNLSGSATAAPAFKIYRWANESATPTVAYSGDPFGVGAFGRLGDVLDVTGSGTGTIIGVARGVGSDPSAVILYTTADGTSFTPVVNSPGGTGNYRAAVAFGGSGELYGKENGDTVRRGTFTAAGVYTEVNSYANSASLPSSISAIGIDPTHRLLVGLNGSTTLGGTQEARLYDISDTTIAPVFLDAQPVGTTNANTNLSGAVDFDATNSVVFVLDTNNGITAFSIPEPASAGLLAIGSIGYLLKRRRA